jgi:hypothetical protein
MIGRMANLVVVLGNGLSVAANERLGLGASTQSFLEAHAPIVMSWIGCLPR